MYKFFWLVHQLITLILENSPKLKIKQQNKCFAHSGKRRASLLHDKQNVLILEFPLRNVLKPKIWNLKLLILQKMAFFNNFLLR